MALVCRQWNMISESDPLWRNLHQTELEELTESLEKEATEKAEAEMLELEELSVDIYDPIFPRRWKDAVVERFLHSSVSDRFK